MTSTLHALDHTSRLVEILADGGLGRSAGAPHDLRAAELCAQTVRAAQVVSGSITSECALSTQAAPIGWSVSPEVAAALAAAERAVRELDAMQRNHRAATLASVTPGKLTAADALARIDTARRLDALARHAWRAAAHLLGRGALAEV
jgi:phosphate:Na+ symporter